MPHDINQMVYAGDVPWHGLGTKLPRNGTWEEIRDAAGFYTATEAPLFLHDGRRDGGTPIPDRKAILRGDTGQYLATVGKGYELVQFAEFAEAGVRAAGDVRALWHTAGTLGENGARGWLLGELPEPIRVRGDQSEIRKFILLTTAHDGSGAATLMNCATRVVCRNTLGTALREREARWSIRHTRSAGQRLNAAANAFRNLLWGYDKFGELANYLAALPFGERQHDFVAAQVIPIPRDGKPHPRLEVQRAKVSELFHTFIGNEGLRGTAWGSFQAFTEFADHHRPRGDRATTENLFESAMLGSAALMKAKALEAILAEAQRPTMSVAAA